MAVTGTAAPLDEFSPEFQTGTVGLLYHDPAFRESTCGILMPDHFDDKIESVYVGIIQKFHKSFPGEELSKDVIFNEVRKLKEGKRIADEEMPEYIRKFALVAKGLPKSAGYIRREIVDFVTAQNLGIELTNSVSKLKKKDFAGVVEGITKAFEKSQKVSGREKFMLRRDLGKRIARYSDPEYEAKKGGIPTGIKDMDALLDAGGVSKGELLVVCGTPGRGKSVFLANCALVAMLSRKNVLYYTLEVAEVIVTKRMDACLTGIPWTELGKHHREVERRWGKIHGLPGLGDLVLYDLPPRFLTPNMIRQDLRQLASEGFATDVLVVDYADIMSSDKHIDERRLEHGDVYEQLRGIAKEFQVDTLTASQANRASLNKKDVDMDAMAEDFSKAMTADYVIGLSQTRAESEEVSMDGRGTGAMRLFLAKNRNGKKGTSIPIMTDFVRMRMSSQDWDEFDVRFYGGPTYKLPLVA